MDNRLQRRVVTSSDKFKLALKRFQGQIVFFLVAEGGGGPEHAGIGVGHRIGVGRYLPIHGASPGEISPEDMVVAEPRPRGHERRIDVKRVAIFLKGILVVAEGEIY